MSAFLKPVELLYRGINRVRRSLYRTGALSSRRLPRAVVSVGNIAIGGSGKTPATIAIARALFARGLRVAILTRGYRGGASESGGGRVDRIDAAWFGDEPALMASKLPGVDVVVGGDRYTSGMQYLRERDCDVFLLDDGFQHLQLQRDIDIVLDLPGAAWTREGRSALADATFVIRRVANLSGSGEAEAALVFTAWRHRGEARPVDTLAGTAVLAFSGLADNEQFFAALEARGAKIESTRGFPDHHRYADSEVHEIKAEASRLGAIPITTEKDHIKLQDPEIAVLEAEMQLSNLDELVKAIAARTPRIVTGPKTG